MRKMIHSLWALMAVLCFSTALFAQTDVDNAQGNAESEVNKGKDTLDAYAGMGPGSMGLGLDIAGRIGMKPNLLNINDKLAQFDGQQTAQQYNNNNNGTGNFTKWTWSNFGTANGLSLGIDASYTLPFMEKVFFVRTGFEYSMLISGKSAKNETTRLSNNTTYTAEYKQSVSSMIIPILLGVQGWVGPSKVYGAVGAIYGKGTYKLDISKSGDDTAQLAATADKEGSAEFSASGLGVRGVLGFVVPIMNNIGLGFEYSHDFNIQSATTVGGLSTDTTKTEDNDAIATAAEILNDSDKQYVKSANATATTAAQGKAPINIGGQTFTLRVVYSL